MIGEFIREIYQGKTLGRILFNMRMKAFCRDMSGSIIDLGGGQSASYYRFLPPEVNIVKTDIYTGRGVDRIVDLNAPLPFQSNMFDAALVLNVLYIVKDPLVTLKEVRRILAPRGILYLSMPFLMNEMPEPHDYRRLTREGLQTLLSEAGFSHVEIYPFGERFSAVANFLHPFYYFNTLRLLVYSISVCLDKVPNSLAKRHPAPIGYMVRAWS